jgi:hypothetical protein
MTGECALLGARTARSARWRQGSGPLALAAVLSVGSSGCSNKSRDARGTDPSGSASSIPTADGNVHGPVDVGGGRMIYVRCTGTGSPTVILEGGDEDTGGSYDFAVPSLAKVTRTCSYDRANLGLSDPAPGPRGCLDRCT